MASRTELHNEVFMVNIPFHIQHADLVRSLAEVFHKTEPFASSSGNVPRNFHVYLHRDRQRKHRHAGRGSLTLASAADVELFLGHYGRPQRPALSWEGAAYVGRGKRLAFVLGKNRVHKENLDFVLSTRYRDPVEIAEHEERIRQVSGGINVINLQFGWACRDDVFSIEWEASKHSAGGVLVQGSAALSFAEDSNDVQVALGCFTTVTPTSVEASYYCVRFRASLVESLAFDDVRSRHPGILFTFNNPPSFELVKLPFSGDGEVTRTRLQHFPCPDGEHKRLAPYISLAMRVECASPKDFAEFRKKSAAVHLPLPWDMPQSAVRRDLWNERRMIYIDSWIARMSSWDVAFQVQSILNNVSLDPTELWDLLPDIDAMQKSPECGPERTREVLVLFNARIRMMGYDQDDDDESTGQTPKQLLQTCKTTVTELHMEMKRRETLNPGIFNCLHVNVTPTRLILDGPYPDQSNRVLRTYPDHHDHFLRVCFVDEENLNYRWDRGVDGAAFVRERVGEILKNPLTIAGRQFDFLAYSTSALREHAVWFVRPFRDDDNNWVTANSIRRSLGDFSHIEFYPARMGARMSQAFTATEPSIRLNLDNDDDEIQVLADIEIKCPRTGKALTCFTDGVGEISKAMARSIARSLQSRPGSRKRFFVNPSAFQFRMGGFKGVIAVNYRLRGMEVRMRQSQKKFDSSAREIEIAQSFYKPKPVYLNRYLIMILETLGVRAPAFVALQDAAVDEVERSSQSLEACSSFLDAHGCGVGFNVSSIFMNLHRIGVGLKSEHNTEYVIDDPFIDRAIEFAATHVLRVMKHKARIPVKGSYTLVGVADVHGWLEPNEVFVCIQERNKKAFCIKGRVLITRSPQVHPGDVQYVNAIGVPPEGSPFEHERFPNCVVFSTRGQRSVPSMLAGGDLDGDEYNVILPGSGLHPPRIHSPAEYPPAVLKRLDHPCRVNDLADWVVDYINSDILGFVADQFLLLADQSELMARDPDCIKLAELASKAVDFAKSGTPVSRNEIPRLRFRNNVRPDWSAGELGQSRNGRIVYPSQRAIGKLFRKINLSDAEKTAAQQAGRQLAQGAKRPEKEEDQALESAMANLAISGPNEIVQRHPITQALRPVLSVYIDVDDSVPAPITDTAQMQFEVFASELKYICSASTLSLKPLTEEEVLMGTILAKTSQPRKRQSHQARLRQQTEQMLKAFRLQLSGGKDGDEDQEELEDRLLKAWAAWQISVLKGTKFAAKSFGMVALFAIFECMRAIEERDGREGGI